MNAIISSAYALSSDVSGVSRIGVGFLKTSSRNRVVRYAGLPALTSPLPSLSFATRPIIGSVIQLAAPAACAAVTRLRMASPGRSRPPVAVVTLVVGRLLAESRRVVLPVVRRPAHRAVAGHRVAGARAQLARRAVHVRRNRVHIRRLVDRQRNLDGAGRQRRRRERASVPARAAGSLAPAAPSVPPCRGSPSEAYVSEHAGSASESAHATVARRPPRRLTTRLPVRRAGLPRSAARSSGRIT